MIISKGSIIIAFRVLLSFTLLTIGGLIYLGWRSGNLVMFQIFGTLGMSNLLTSIRNVGTEYSLFEWVKYSVPDGLWLFSYMFLIDTIWQNHRYASYYIFLWSLPAISIISELLQYFAIVPGTFDIVDLACYILAIVIFMILKFI